MAYYTTRIPERCGGAHLVRAAHLSVVAAVCCCCQAIITTEAGKAAFLARDGWHATAADARKGHHFGVSVHLQLRVDAHQLNLGVFAGVVHQPVKGLAEAWGHSVDHLPGGHRQLVPVGLIPHIELGEHTQENDLDPAHSETGQLAPTPVTITVAVAVVVAVATYPDTSSILLCLICLNLGMALGINVSKGAVSWANEAMCPR